MRPRGSKDKINRKKRSMWTDDQKTLFEDNFCKMSYIELAKLCDKSEDSIRKEAYKRGWHKIGATKKMENPSEAGDICGIYILVNNRNDKIFIGCSENIGQRVQANYECLRCGKHQNQDLQKDFSSGDTFHFCVVQEVGKDELNDCLQGYLRGANPDFCYNKKINHEEYPVVDNFWDRVDKKNDNECWNWLGKVGTYGYGYLKQKHKVYQAHRMAYFLYYGILTSDVVMHKCDNRLCCNPHHLIQGTAGDNVHDCMEKGRFIRRKSKISEEQVCMIFQLTYDGLSQTQIGNRLKLPESTIYNILHNKIQSLEHIINKYKKPEQKSHNNFDNFFKECIEITYDIRDMIDLRDLYKRYEDWSQIEIEHIKKIGPMLKGFPRLSKKWVCGLKFQ